MSYERDNIKAMAGYVPGEQPAETKVVKLNTNENPYPPCQAVLAAVRAVPAELLRRYPPPSAPAFRKAAAKAHGLSPDQVIATNGGDELLRLAVTVFCDPHGNAAAARMPSGGEGGVAVGEPSYSLYPVLAEIQDTRLTRLPLADDWSLPADFGTRAIAAGAKLVIVVNPHAPSGRLESVERLQSLAIELAGKAVLMVDEAYVDFAQRDAVPLVASGLDNVLLLRTLSKGYSLAGLRFGYGLAHASLIAALNKAIDSYPTDILAQAAATAAIEHRDQARRSWGLVTAERARLSNELTRRGWRVFPSESNFILVVPPPSRQARSVYQSLKDRHIFVRYFDQDRLRDKLRITVGTPEQDNALLDALDAMP